MQLANLPDRLYRTSVEMYYGLVRRKAFEGDWVELLEGVLLRRAPRGEPHATANSVLSRRLILLDLQGWVVRIFGAVMTADSVAAPDVCVARGNLDTYATLDRPPFAPEVGLIVEVAETEVEFDRRDKGRIYARAGFAEYWLIDIPGRRVEVYTDPDPMADIPRPSGLCSR